MTAAGAQRARRCSRVGFGTGWCLLGVPPPLDLHLVSREHRKSYQHTLISTAFIFATVPH